MKNDLPYFSHDNNARNHPKMKALISEFGYEGYGRFWALNERIAETPGAFFDISRKVNKLDLANELRLDSKGLDQFLSFLSDPEIDLINIEDGKLTTDRITEIYSEIMKNRENERDKKKKSKGKCNFPEGKSDFPEGKSDFPDEFPREKDTNKIRSNKSKSNKTKKEKNKKNDCGSTEPPPPKQKPDKPKKLPLREREPENDMEFVEKAYWTNWDMLYSKQIVKTKDPKVNWIQTRTLIKRHLETLKPEQLAYVINQALYDKWIMEKGYSLELILKSSFVNSVINKTHAIPLESDKQLIIQTPLYKAALFCFETDNRAKAIIYQDEYSADMQMRCLNDIVLRCRNIMPEMPIDFLKNILEHFKILCNGKYKGKWTFTPRCLRTNWVWELVIDSLPENNITPEIYQSIKGMFT